MMIQNIHNPIPVLQQPKSQVLSNSLVPNTLQEETVQLPTHNTPSLLDISIRNVATGMSSSVLGFMEDIFHKSDSDSWIEHFQYSAIKEQRYMYFGILCIFIASILLLFK